MKTIQTEPFLNKLTEYKKEFENFYNYLAEENKKYNLIGNLTKEEVYEKLFLDSLILSYFIKPKFKILDVGVGAGFPSIPNKIINSNINITMIDSLNKRINFLNTFIQTDNLQNCIAVHTRAEDFLKTGSKFNLVTAKAVAPLNKLLPLLAPFLNSAGKLISFKGSNYQTEIDSLNNLDKKLNLTLTEIYEYTLPISKQKRYILEYTHN